jgi:Family of unknown function (DUF5759)
MQATKLNLDELFEFKKEQDLNTLKTYNLILDRVHVNIKRTSRQKIENQCCWYVVPEFILGVPRYDVKNCIAYIVKELQDNGFKVTYTHPNLLFIVWSHWVPDYVRMEYKKQTGVSIDGYGKEVKQDVVEKIPSIIKSTSSYKPSGLIYKDDFIRLI